MTSDRMIASSGDRVAEVATAIEQELATIKIELAEMRQLLEKMSGRGDFK